MNDAAKAYRKWIMSQRLEGCTLADGKGDGISVEGDLVKGWIGFYRIFTLRTPFFCEAIERW